jgi:hypothetical protein
MENVNVFAKVAVMMSLSLSPFILSTMDFNSFKDGMVMEIVGEGSEGSSIS